MRDPAAAGLMRLSIGGIMSALEVIASVGAAIIVVVGIALRVRDLAKKKAEDIGPQPDDAVRRAIGDEECFM